MLKKLAQRFTEDAPQVPALSRKSAYKYMGEDNYEISGVEYPIPIITASKPMYLKNIYKAPLNHVRETHNKITLTAPKVEAKNIFQSTNTAKEPLTRSTIFQK